MTYRELNQKANQLAKRLRTLGVGPNDFVAISGERSMELIIGIYGILKAGGAYVPIDFSFPKERIQYILKDCSPKAVLLYQAEINTDIPVIDLEKKRLWEEETSNLNKLHKPSDLVYCIYTSGTTGKPKGIMLTEFINKKTIGCADRA
jgi:surfactin family lipopeptide synthetase A